jgi:putative transposase
VWCTKYRKPVLVNETEQSLKESLQQTAETLKINIVEMECMPDHIHLLVECSPQHFIPDMVKVLKGNSARYIFMAYSELKKQLWGGHLWNPSYFVATVSDSTRTQIQEYIASQKMKD